MTGIVIDQPAWSPGDGFLDVNASEDVSDCFANPTAWAVTLDGAGAEVLDVQFPGGTIVRIFVDLTAPGEATPYTVDITSSEAIHRGGPGLAESPQHLDGTTIA